MQLNRTLQAAIDSITAILAPGGIVASHMYVRDAVNPNLWFPVIGTVAPPQLTVIDYGNQGLIFTQEPATGIQYTILSLAGGLTPYDARQIRPLVASDIVSLSDYPKIATSFYGQAVAGGNTTIVAGVANKKHRIRCIMVFNSGAANITVYLRFGAAGAARFQTTLAANSGWNMNLIGAYWESATAEDFIANLSGAGTVDVSGMYEEI